MRRIRSRLTIIMLLTIIGTSIVSLTLSALVRNNVILQRDVMRYMLFGFPVWDVVLLVVCVAAALTLVLVVSRNTVNPVVELNRATKEIASGNFDIKVDIRDNIEEFGELQENFNRMAAELRSNEYLRKDFIANVSHQLRTPLSIVHGYAELLAEGGLSQGEQREYALYIAREAERLTLLTGDMLRLSRMDNRALRLREQHFQLDEQIRRAILRLEPRWYEKKLEIEPELQPVSYAGDEELLGQVWDNLLDNAVKFTPPGGRIAVRLWEEETAVCVSVADSGPGMTEEALQRLFEQFYRGDANSKDEGNGLGLSLARRIAELHGGSIEAANAEEGGAVFTVRLPQKAKSSKGAKARRS